MSEAQALIWTGLIVFAFTSGFLTGANYVRSEGRKHWLNYWKQSTPTELEQQERRLRLVKGTRFCDHG